MGQVFTLHSSHCVKGWLRSDVESQDIVVFEIWEIWLAGSLLTSIPLVQVLRYSAACREPARMYGEVRISRLRDYGPLGVLQPFDMHHAMIKIRGAVSRYGYAGYSVASGVNMLPRSANRVAGTVARQPRRGFLIARRSKPDLHA
jgi:hypothetical protein